eukprot:Gb_04204 [translate_table: standard]
MIEYFKKLANLNRSRAEPEEQESFKWIVWELYTALRCGDAETVQRILAADLEWWFHGPPCCQHMMRLLTGASTYSQFSFNPKSISAVGDKVFVEGFEDESVYWVHVWTVKDGLITQIREYFNTSITVTEFSPSLVGQSQSCSTLWESEIGKSKGKSMPGLVLAV